jgi:hypothetical protein
MRLTEPGVEGSATNFANRPGVGATVGGVAALAQVIEHCRIAEAQQWTHLRCSAPPGA